MRAHARLRFLLPAAAAVLTAAPAIAAVPSATSTQPSAAVGGPALATHGTISGRAAGVAAAPAVSASSYVIADLDSGEVLAAKDPHGLYAPASTLKSLTALTLVPKLDPTSTVVATREDANVDGSTVGVQPGKRYRVSQLFEAMLMVSGNDAALTLATANGGIPKTVAEMNEQARSIGALDTVALTPNGLDARGQHSSAYDLALIARHGLELPAFAGYVKERRSHFGAIGAKPYEIYTHNKLVLRYAGAFGVKNGYTVAARASFVGAAQRGDHRLVVTLMHANPTVWQEAAKLLDWGFANRAKLTAVGTLDAQGHEVDPGPLTAPAYESTVRVTHDRPHSGGFSVPAAPAAAAGAVLVGFVALRRASTRSRRRRGGRLKLPPI
jgi:D-alanyl-D-alanine carboxypeptidase (penicillin-binding protein 5/6)